MNKRLVIACALLLVAVAIAWAADDSVTIPNQGKSLDMKSRTTGAGNVLAQAGVICDPTSTTCAGVDSDGLKVKIQPAIPAGAADNSSNATSKWPTLSLVFNAAAPSRTETNMGPARGRLDGSLAVFLPDGGETNAQKTSTASTNATSVTTTSTIVAGFDCQNPSTSTVAYVHMYNKASAPSPGSDHASLIGSWPVSAASASGVLGGISKVFHADGLGGFTAGFAYTITGNSDDTQTTNAPATVQCNFQYHAKAS